uniref:Si:ch211-173a9.6 n=1 Tax=Danio rerio TaxID=7955 RepID=E7EY81_DANRE|nr:olfactomedin-4 [Danio rerio]|eukprot:XP_021323184.1 olfactomedin-4 [Danio rerio]
MIVTLLPIILFRAAVVQGAVSLWAEGSASSGECICEAFLPNSTFPIGQLVLLESTAVEIKYKLEMEISKVEVYEVKLQVYIAKMKNLTVLIELMEDDPDSYNELHLEEVKIQIKQVEALIVELQASIKASSSVLISIRTQVITMISVLTQLEITYDKNLVLVTRREYLILQQKLEECERRHDEIFNPNIGICNHRGIRRISKPIVSQLNADLNGAFKYGGWGKDSKPLSGSESMYWYSGSSDTLVSKISQYSAYYTLITRQSFKAHLLYVDRQYDWRGAGNNYVVRENNLYYQYRSPFAMAKFNMTSAKVETKVVPKASAQFSYHYSANQNLDFAADESGLWVTYATADSKGKLVLGKINEQSFAVETVFQTSVYKPSVGNTFMVCGVLYATRSVDTKTEEIFYTFDTRTEKESYVSIPFEKFHDFYSYLDYNPTDQKLYMFNNGYYVSYHVWFNQEASADKSLVD